MPTKNPRINVVLEPALYTILCKLAQREGVSISHFSRDLIKEAIEIREDIYWQEVAQKREKSFSQENAVSHKDVWN